MNYPTKDSLPLRMGNFFASLFLILTVYLFYRIIPYYQGYAAQELHSISFTFSAQHALDSVYIFYTALLLLYYLIEKKPQKSKSVYCLRVLSKLISHPVRTVYDGLSRLERLGILSILLKAFFAPLMVFWLIDHTAHMIDNGYYLINHRSLLKNEFLAVFNSHGFWFLFQFILFLDVLFFTIGYLVEMPGLKNQIRSVDPTLFGWVVALACYPPLNEGLTGRILSWQPVDFPQFSIPAVHISVNFMLLGLMAIYTSASLALNFKASNLTHRGIVASGPYRFVRHPAYTCKNLAWWTGAIPTLLAAFEISWWQVVLVLSSLGGWTLVYTLRALTEEEHLRKVDNEYDRYCAQVKYRFIPGVL